MDRQAERRAFRDRRDPESRGEYLIFSRTLGGETIVHRYQHSVGGEIIQPGTVLYDGPVRRKEERRKAYYLP